MLTAKKCDIIELGKCFLTRRTIFTELNGCIGAGTGIVSLSLGSIRSERASPDSSGRIITTDLRRYLRIIFRIQLTLVFTSLRDAAAGT